MRNFKKLFSKNETSINRLESVYEDVDTSIDITSEYLYAIEEDLLKLEMISRLSDDPYLETKILYYREKLQSLKDEYVLGSSDSKTVLSTHEKDLNYKIQLSLLLDETHLLSKKYFYLNSFDAFLEQSVDESNFDGKKKELLESEIEIKNYLNGNDSVDKKLRDRLIDVIWYFLEQEVKLSKNLDFYMKLSRKTQLLIQEKFLAELLKRVDQDSYIEEYIKKSDMEQLTFDYDIFSYIVLGQEKVASEKTESKESQTELKESQLVVPASIENLKLNFDFLRKNQLSGFGKLGIFKKRGIEAAATDFAIARGNRIQEIDSIDQHILERRYGCYFSKTLSSFMVSHPSLYTVSEQGKIDGTSLFAYNIGCRPILLFSTIQNFCLNKNIDSDGILMVEFGEYPQMAADRTTQHLLEQLFPDSLKSTNRKFSMMNDFSNADLILSHENYPNKSFIEYILNNKRYVRVRVHISNSSIYLSNGIKYKEGDYVWIEVQPIRWLVDEKTGLAVSEKILFMGNVLEGHFECSCIKDFMDYDFAKDIIQSKIDVKNEEDIICTSSPLSLEQKDFLASLNSDQIAALESILSGNQVGVSNYLKELSNQSSKVKQY